jgi:cell division protein FtsW (lipid II flippase)
MKHIAAWKWLSGACAVFWIIFAVVLFSAQIPFLIVSMALMVVLALSVCMVALARAYQRDS